MIRVANNSAKLLGIPILCILSGLVLYLGIFLPAEPPVSPPPRVFDSTYDELPLEAVLSTSRFQARVDQIKALGQVSGERQIGRYTGSPGFYRTENLVKGVFENAGLEVTTQEFSVVVPVTEYCEVLDENGHPLPNVTLYPFEPGGMIPVALPEEGLEAELLVTHSTESLDLVGKNIENRIVLNTGINCAWPNLAYMGAKAVIVKEGEKDRLADPDTAANWHTMTSYLDLAYPRFYVRGPLEAYEGKKIRIFCKVIWQSMPVRNIVGVLRGSDGAKEALIITSYYDSYSVVPEIAPGAEQSLSLAAMLEMVDALSQYKGQLKRDIVFVAAAAHGQSLEGTSNLLGAIETFSRGFSGYKSHESLLREQERLLGYARTGLEIIESDEAWTTEDNSAYRSRWLRQDPRFRKWFEKCFRVVAGEIHLEAQEKTLQKRLDWLRAGSPSFVAKSTKALDAKGSAGGISHPLLDAYVKSKQIDAEMGDLVSTPFWLITSKSPQESLDWSYRERFHRYIRESVIPYHERRILEITDDIRLRDLFSEYSKTLTLSLELFSGGKNQLKDLAILVGWKNPGTVVEPQSTEIREALADHVPYDEMNGPAFNVTSWGIKDASGDPQDPFLFYTGTHNDMASKTWFRCGKQAFTITSKLFCPQKISTPADRFETLSTAVVREQLLPVAKGILAMGYGRVAFRSVPFIMRDAHLAPLSPTTGFVFGRAGTGSLIPDHPMTERTFIRNYKNLHYPPDRGSRSYLIMQTDPYGGYYRKLPIQISLISVDAVRFNNAGMPVYYKDASASGQQAFRNIDVPNSSMNSGKANIVNVAMFRCAPVACFTRINPTTLALFPGYNYLDKSTMEPPNGFAQPFDGDSPGMVAFLPPDLRFYLAMKDGSADHPDIQTYRAVGLRVDPAAPYAGLRSKISDGRDEPEVFGKGFLAADNPNLLFLHQDAAASMLRTNEKRLRTLSRYNMADENMLEIHKESENWLSRSVELRSQGRSVEAVNAEQRSLALAMNNHPVIRKKISHSVLGIIWYLVLLVPFVTFFEKLVFTYTDVRKQLLTNGIIFVIVFSLLRYFHPAFQMVRSAPMILLGFLMLLLSVIISTMVAGKFSQIAGQLRRKEGFVEGADISRSGVIGTAFMVGINNMRRRKMRTGLTCMTLTLVAFVMICFASVSMDVVESEYATGSSFSDGIMRRDQFYRPLAESEFHNFQQIYGLQYPVTCHYWLVGGFERSGSTTNVSVLQNTSIGIEYEAKVGEHKTRRQSRVNAAMTMLWNEPLFSGIDRYLLTSRGWFHRVFDDSGDPSQQNVLEDYVILPDSVAKELGISVDEVNDSRVKIRIRGSEYEVLGIIDSRKLTDHRGMDGRSILPYDLNTDQKLVQEIGWKVRAPEDIRRLRGEQVIVVNRAPPRSLTDQYFLASCFVLFPNSLYGLRADQSTFPSVTYKDKRSLIREYLQRIGKGAYYSVDRISYSGVVRRGKSVAGLIDIVIPMLIVAMTVFNTMRGSVYERKDEIYVYNAIGIAPNHVFFMFMAEASVYAVIGIMSGYLLSQVTATLLAIGGFTAGLNLDYGAVETIYVSVVIMISVLLSTIIPARIAAKMAVPSDQAKWSIPEAEGDLMAFNLPFTFTGRDRMAVIGYFYRWFDGHGQGSLGKFFCEKPHLWAKESEDENLDVLVPGVETTMWLKPFDLGVSHKVVIALPTDLQTGEFIAKITIERLSGTLAAWNRTLPPFLSTLRKQFLSWRAVTDMERAEMYKEVRMLFATIECEEHKDV